MKEDTMRKDEEDLLSLQKNPMTDMLNRRHKERQLHLTNLQSIKLKDQASSENQDYFMDLFLEQFREVELNLNNIQQEDSVSLTKKFNKISSSIQELQGYLSSSTLFLPEYKVKSAQKRIDTLSGQFETAKNKLLPKKRFGFKSKQIEVQSDEKSKVDNDIDGGSSKLDLPSKQKHINWTVEGKSNEEILLQGDDVNHKDITISSLENCLVQIVGHPGSLQMSNLKNCLILCGPVARSVFADNCSSSKLIFGCQQFRFHWSRNCQVYMHVTSRAIIEDCTNISVAPYNYTYPAIDLDFIQSGLDPKTNNWQDVADFNWLALEHQSPNWKVIKADDRIDDWQLIVDQFRREFI